MPARPWLLFTAALIAISGAAASYISRLGDAGRGWEALLAALSALLTMTYCAMPFRLLALDDRAPAVAAIATFCAIIKRSARVRPLADHRRASLLTSMGATTASLVTHGTTDRPLETFLAWIAATCFLIYAVGTALRKRRLEVQLASALASAQEGASQAQAANAAKSTFLANVSHEVRTPLNGVLGMAQVMARTEPDPVRQEEFRIMLRAGAALSEVLNDVLDLSKIEAGRLSLDPQRFQLHELLRSVVALHAPRALEKGLKLGVEIDRSVPEVWRADSARLRQVLQNLLSNAVKVTATGSIMLRADHQQGERRRPQVRLGPRQGGKPRLRSHWRSQERSGQSSATRSKAAKRDGKLAAVEQKGISTDRPAPMREPDKPVMHQWRQTHPCRSRRPLKGSRRRQMSPDKVAPSVAIIQVPDPSRRRQRRVISPSGSVAEAEYEARHQPL